MIRVTIKTSLVLLLCTLVFACKKQLANQQKDILGEWIYMRSTHHPDKKDVRPIFPPMSKPTGFRFSSSNIFENKDGYYNWDEDKTIYLGNLSKYMLKNDSLYLWEPVKKQWEVFKIFKLTADSLIIGGNELRHDVYKRVIPNTESPKFEKIIISASGCFGSCPMMSISIDSSGSVLYNGQHYNSKNGFYKSQVSPSVFKELQNNFRKSDFSKLKLTYSVGYSDAQSFTITFIKNGKVYKTVDDYGGAAPHEFTWAYRPLMYLYQKINLQSTVEPNHLKGMASAGRAIFWVNNKALDVPKSELFFLFQKIDNGKTLKETDVKTNLSFKFPSSSNYYNIKTDGRYFKFTPKAKGSPIVIDIGYNFLTEKLKTNQWREVSEYDNID
jgi:hypothetical protein